MHSLRKWILATAAIISFVVVDASQAVEIGDSARLLSYDQLLRLTPSKREEYLRNLRDLLMDLAAHAEKNKNGFALEEIRELNEYIALFQGVIPEANAEGNVLPLVHDAEPIYKGT